MPVSIVIDLHITLKLLHVYAYKHRSYRQFKARRSCSLITIITIMYLTQMFNMDRRRMVDGQTIHK